MCGGVDTVDFFFPMNSVWLVVKFMGLSASQLDFDFYHSAQAAFGVHIHSFSISRRTLSYKNKKKKKRH
jgi:uncharacterized membrane protein